MTSINIAVQVSCYREPSSNVTARYNAVILICGPFRPNEPGLVLCTERDRIIHYFPIPTSLRTVLFWALCRGGGYFFHFVSYPSTGNKKWVKFPANVVVEPTMIRSRNHRQIITILLHCYLLSWIRYIVYIYWLIYVL